MATLIGSYADHAPGQDCRVIDMCRICRRPIYCCEDGSRRDGPAHVDCLIAEHEMTPCEY